MTKGSSNIIADFTIKEWCLDCVLILPSDSAVEEVVAQINGDYGLRSIKGIAALASFILLVHDKHTGHRLFSCDDIHRLCRRPLRIINDVLAATDCNIVAQIETMLISEKEKKNAKHVNKRRSTKKE